MPTMEIVEEVKPIELTTEETIRKEFADIPLMIEIARCESEFRQFNKNGTVLTGYVDPRDTGVFQINTYYHLNTSQQLGLDIFTLKGNMAYARWLYEREGSRPWNASKPCWNPHREIVI